MTYLKVTLSDGTNFIIPPGNRETLMDDIAEAVLEGRQETYFVEFVQMTEEEFDAMEEYNP